MTRKEQKKENVKRRNRKAGFTLIEIILVVIIIGILAGIALPHLGGKTERAQIARAKADINALSMAIREFEMVNGYYPSSLDQLLDESKGGPFLAKKVIPKDPWGKPYSYSAPGAHNTHSFDLSCTTPKGKVINNWE